MANADVRVNGRLLHARNMVEERGVFNTQQL
jgi:hypothetical protein